MSTLNIEQKLTAETAATTLRGVVREALEAAGWHITVSENWSKTLWVNREGDTIGDSVADIVVAVGKRDYYTVVEATINPRWRITRKVTYWAGANDGWTFSAEKVAKIVARVQAIAEAIAAKAKAQAESKAWREKEEARKNEAMKPVRDFMEAHGIGIGWENKYKVRELGESSIKLDGLTREQMLAILAIIKPEGEQA